MDNELFGERHEQEENGLFGKRHEDEQLTFKIITDMNKEQNKQMDTFYQEQVKSGLISNLDGALGFKVGYEKAFSLNSVSQQRELLNALANDFNNSTDTYVGEKTIEKTLKAFNCG